MSKTISAQSSARSIDIGSISAIVDSNGKVIKNKRSLRRAANNSRIKRYEITSITIRHSCADKHYTCLTLDDNMSKTISAQSSARSIDIGSISAIVDSNGKVIKNKRSLRRAANNSRIKRYEITSITIRHSCADKHYTCLTLDDNMSKTISAQSSARSIDIGSISAIVDSNGKVIKNKRSLRRAANNLRKNRNH